MNTSVVPYELSLIICLDLDHTMIGDIKCQVCEWELIQKFEPSKMRLFRENLKTQLQQSILIRPGLKHFLVTLTAGQTEFFVYTASDKRWAQFFVPILEDVLGIRFNRPILTRAHCIHVPPNNALQKSLVHVETPITSVLRKKYKHGNGGVPIDRAFVSKHILLVDNMYVLPANERHRMIKTWSYNYTYETDVLRLLSESTILQHLRDILKILRRYRVHVFTIQPHLTYEEFRVLYYMKLAQDIQRAWDATSIALRDDFWIRLTKAMVSLPPEARYKDKSIRLIQHSIPSSRHARAIV